MPKAKRGRLPGDEFQLTFGKHAGKQLCQLGGRSFRYIVWLAGYSEHEGVMMETGRKAARLNRTKRQLAESDDGLGEICVHCRYKTLGDERDNIFRCTLAGETEAETMVNLERHWDCQFARRFHSYYSAWVHVNREHPDAVEAARRYLELNRICLYCGKPQANPLPAAQSCGCRPSKE